VVRHPYEGRIVLAITGDHGVHLFDPLGILVPVALTLVLLRMRRRRSSEHATV
jgi:uncharacterized protein (TIGR03382 family)